MGESTKRTFAIPIIVAIVLVSALIVFLCFFGSAPSKTTGASSKSVPSIYVTPVNITYANIARVLSANSMVKDLPTSATILLRFYNFNSGTRQWEKSYILKRGDVQEGNTAADMTIIISSKYLSELTSSNLCSVLQKAQKNGDFSTESTMSTLSLMWKYRSMMKYRSCLGL